MSNEQIIDDIRGLVRSIPRDIGMYASLSEGREASGEILLSAYLDESKGPRIIQAGTAPQNGELTLEEMREELLAWITDRRKAA
ncbi:hypothetical protein [Halomonas elongata]|uniref:hypothetical protein n=1 Tax=Halomonas elongata TaxID=2746 RepID=UPI0023B175A6|nr:hypothetical protein [Halomonas elongata]